MATTTTEKAFCVICHKGNGAFKCTGCSQHFCYRHVRDHRQVLSQQFDEIVDNCDIFRQTLTDQTTDSKQHPLIKQIDRWEVESINKIRQTAEEAKQLVLKHIVDHTAQIESRLKKLTDQLRQGREEDDFFETNLKQWKEELKQLTEEFDKPSNIKLQEDSTAFLNRIRVNIKPINIALRSTNLGTSTKWLENGVTVVGDIGRGEGLNQLSSPLGIYIDDNQTIYIADHWNHRIVACRSEALYSQVVAGGNGEGNRTDQLNGPTDIVIDKAKHFLIISDQGNRRVLRWPFQKDAHGEKIISDIDCYGIAMDDNGCLYISDIEKHEVRRFSRGETRGTRVAGGKGQGNRLDQLDYPTYLFVDHEYSVYVSDRNNHRVMKWIKDANKGIVVAGGQGEGNGPGQLPNPCGLAVDRLDNVYVVDGNNHRVMRWSKGATQGDTVAGEYGKGTEAYQLNGPTGLSFDQQGNLYVVDWGNNRVQRFDIDTSSNF